MDSTDHVRVHRDVQNAAFRSATRFTTAAGDLIGDRCFRSRPRASILQGMPFADLKVGIEAVRARRVRTGGDHDACAPGDPLEPPAAAAEAAAAVLTPTDSWWTA
jgi:hypothetical protein